MVGREGADAANDDASPCVVGAKTKTTNEAADNAADEDDHNYEITDFSMVTPWERLIQQVEDILKAWGVGGGLLGGAWDSDFPPTREHTVLNYSQTKGVRHRSQALEYDGRKLVLRHVTWLPEGTAAGSGGVCGVERLWQKRSSAATSANYIHELGCCLGLGNYLILAPESRRGGGLFGAAGAAGAGAMTRKECALLRSTLSVACGNVGCCLAGLTPTAGEARAAPDARADFPFTFQGLQVVGRRVVRHWCYLDAQASQETAAAMRSPYGALLYMRARHCHPADTVVMSVRETHFVVEDGVPQVLMRPVAVVCTDEAAHEPAQSGCCMYVCIRQT